MPPKITDFIRRLWSTSIVKNSGILILANAIVTILGVIRTPLMTWIIPKPEIGMMGVLAAWLPFVQLFSLPGLDTSIYHYISQKKTAAFLVGLKARLIWSLLSSLCFLGISAFFYFRSQSSLAILFVITGITFPLSYGLSATVSYISASESFKALFWYRIWESLTDFAGFIPLFFSLLFVNRIITFYGANQIATMAMQIIVSIWLLSIFKKKKPPQLTDPEKDTMLRYGKHLTTISGITLVQSKADSALVSAMLSLNTIADYSIANLVAEQFKKLWVIYVTIRYPPLARLPVSSRRERIVFEGIILTFGLAILIVLAIFAAHILIPILLPKVYSASLQFIDILGLATILSTPGLMAELYFRTQQNEKKQINLRLYSAILGVITSIVLIPAWGASGSAVGRLVSNLTMSSLGIVFFFYDARGKSKFENSKLS